MARPSLTAVDLKRILPFIGMAMRNTEEAYQSWRDRVFAGIEQVEPATESLHRVALQEWLDRFDSLSPEINQADWNSADAELLPLRDEVFRGQSRIRGILSSWKPPALSKNPSLRRITMTNVESERIKEILKSGAAVIRIPQG